MSRQVTASVERMKAAIDRLGGAAETGSAPADAAAEIEARIRKLGLQRRLRGDEKTDGLIARLERLLGRPRTGRGAANP